MPSPDNGQALRRSPRKPSKSNEDEDVVIVSPSPAQRAPVKPRGAPKKASSKPIAQQTDEEVWHLDDSEIIGTEND
jgi:hypothetical protein